ncbi:MAG: hypothetical protein K2Y16_07950 [Burkholderiales bacterium]|nr:hypothetical protein [Burkholderiales bacterium]
MDVVENLRLMFSRLFQLKVCTNQEVECKVMRNGVRMSGFFSALGSTNMEICHAHAREKDCTELCSQPVESDSRGTTRIVVRGGDVLTPADVYVHGQAIELPKWQGWAQAAQEKLKELAQGARLPELGQRAPGLAVVAA